MPLLPEFPVTPAELEELAHLPADVAPIMAIIPRLIGEHMALLREKSRRDVSDARLISLTETSVDLGVIEGGIASITFHTTARGVIEDTLLDLVKRGPCTIGDLVRALAAGAR